MNFLRDFSKILMIPPVITFLYDAVRSWFVDAHFKIRSFQEWCIFLDKDLFDKAKPGLLKILPPTKLDLLLKLPAPATLLIFPFVMYITYRILFYIK